MSRWRLVKVIPAGTVLTPRLHAADDVLRVAASRPSCRGVLAADLLTRIRNESTKRTPAPPAVPVRIGDGVREAKPNPF